MALKFTISRLEDVAAPLREHYARVGDKFQLATEGEHPKVTEFRDTNTRLMGEIKRFEGIDPDAIAADRSRFAELDALKASLATKELELTAKTAALTKSQQQADALVLETRISDVFLKAGGLPKARGVIAAAAASQFIVEDGVLKSKLMSPDRPGEPMSVEEFMTLQSRENNFCFAPSSGGGADPKRGGGTVDANVLKNPTPQQLGEHGDAIRRGDMKVEYTT